MSVRSTLACLGVLVLATGCGADPHPLDGSRPIEVADARPSVSAGGEGDHSAVTAEPDVDHPDDGHGHVSPPTAAGPSAAVATGTSRAAEARRLQGTVPRAEVCPLVGPAGCDLLPDLLSPAEVALVEWGLTHLTSPPDTAGVWVETAHAVCAVLDTLSWDELVRRAEHVSTTGTDPDVVAMVRTMPFAAPQATTFLCPEHLDSTRRQMTAAVCSELSPQVCADFEEDWLR
jgi:hypothetical protein